MLIQLLCPARHCVVAVSYDTNEMPDDVALVTMQQGVEQMFREQIIMPYCGICGSKELKYEQRKTRFATMQEAKREMNKCHDEQMLSRLLIDMEKANRN